MPKKPCAWCDKLADSSYLAVTSRLGVIGVGMLSIWILSNVSSMKTDMAMALATMQGYDRRIGNLEDWRNTFASFTAPEGNTPHARKN